MVTRNDKQRSVIHQTTLLCFLKEMLQRFINPVDAAHCNKLIAAHIVRHFVPAEAGVRIRLMHIQRFGDHHQTVILCLCLFQQLQCFLIHYVIMEAPAAGTCIALLFQIFFCIVFVHAELRRILAQLVSIILAGSIHENAAHSRCLHAAEQRWRIFTGKILIHNQMRTEGSIQALRCRHGRGIIPVHMRITDNKTI